MTTRHKSCPTDVKKNRLWSRLGLRLIIIIQRTSKTTSKSSSFIFLPLSYHTLARSDAIQCCHSTKIENPRRATEKNPENPRSNFYTLCGKIELFLEKNRTFSEKSGFSSPKFLMTLLIDQKLKKQLVPHFFTKNHLLSTKKHCKI